MFSVGPFSKLGGPQWHAFTYVLEPPPDKMLRWTPAELAPGRHCLSSQVRSWP